ncbi:MAG: MBL fold metallo-hydrolase, partial [Pseudomonadota bacterium]
VKFWGVRGTCPRSELHFSKFGGSTSCVEATLGTDHFIFDAGSGLIALGEDILTRKKSHQYNFLISHFHIDHLMGWPFFVPAYRSDYCFDFYAAELGKATLKRALSNLMSPPYFPVGMKVMKSKLNFHSFTKGAVFNWQNAQIKTHALNHPGGSTGYRLDANGISLCYITDHEHVVGQRNDALIDFIKNCDLLIYDSTYDDDEFHQFVGWGHSTWQEGLRIAKAGNVKKYAIFHHSPTRKDECLERIDAQAKKKMKGAFVARQNDVITL